MKKISFCIVNYGGMLDTLECINSIKLAAFSYNIHIIVVDNNSPNGDYNKMLLSFGGDIQESFFNGYLVSKVYFSNEGYLYFVKNTRNSGFGAANNIGIGYAKYNNFDICILLNNDTIVEKKFIEKVCGYLCDKDFKCAFSVKSLSYYSHSVVDSLGFGYVNMRTGETSHVKKYPKRYLVGSCIIMNNINDIPYFDENFFLYYEDIDYSFKLIESGYTLMYNDMIHIKHKINASTKLSPNLEKIKIESLVYFVAKYSSGMDYCLFIALRVVYYILHLRIKQLVFFLKNVELCNKKRL